MAENKEVKYCFGYEKMYFMGKEYVYVVAFVNVVNGKAEQIALATIGDDDRNADGWRKLLTKAKDKIGDAKYLLFKDVSFNFVLDTSDILPDVKYCSNIGVIDYNEEYRDESLALANDISSKLSSFRPDGGLESSLPALTGLFKTLGAVKVSVII